MKKPRRGTAPLALVFALTGSVPACVDEHVSPNVTEGSIDPYLEFAQFLTFGIPDDGGGVVITAVHPDEMGLEYRGAMTVPGTEMLAYRGPLIPSEYLYARAILQGMSTERSSYMVFVRDPERMADRIPPEMESRACFRSKGVAWCIRASCPRRLQRLTSHRLMTSAHRPRVAVYQIGKTRRARTNTE